MNQDNRYHALDNLRAVIMWLGIVLHVAVQHLQGESFLPWGDSQTTLFADLLTLWIHMFRMPVFFILAGFFSAMLVAKYGHRAMLKSRARRVALPFLVFWPFIFILTIVLVMSYIHVMKTGFIGIDPELIQPNPNYHHPSEPQPLLNTMHFWFIYYLMLFCLISLPVCTLFKNLNRHIVEKLNAALLLFACRWWAFLILSLPLAMVGVFFKFGMVTPSGSFVPNIYELIHNGVFFCFGWFFHANRQILFAYFSQNCWRFFIIANFMFIAVLGCFNLEQQKMLAEIQINSLMAYVYNCATWLWSFAIIGLFLRYLQDHNKFMRYLSDSSYWVYIVHMLGTIGFGVLLYTTDFSALQKMMLNILLTTAMCLISYQVFVRYTFIGQFLNGHKHQRIKDIKIND